MMENKSILNYESSHLSRLIEIIRSNTPLYFAEHEEAEYEDYLKNHTELYYVYKADNKIVACGGINFSEDKKEAFMSWGMVDQAYHGRGLGKFMTQHRLKILKNYKNLESITTKTSQKTTEFYEKMGFKIIRKEKDFWAEGLDLVEMHYEL